MLKLGEILVSTGHLTPEGVGEALDWQVLYGGRLGTNLLELRLVSEEQLARALGKQLGAEVAWGELLVDPALVPVIPPQIANRFEMVPWKVDKRRVKVLCCEIRVDELDKLSYKLGRNCVPVVAPEFRIFQLLRAHYGAVRQMRALDFGIVPDEALRRKRQKQKDKAAAAEPTQELIDESAFNEIYNQVLQGRSAGPAAPQPAASVPTPPPLAVAPRGPPVQTPAQRPAVAQATPAPARAPIQAPPAEPALEELPIDAIVGEAPAEGPQAIETPAEPLRPVQWDEVPISQPARDESPLAFKDALRLLEGVTDRDSIAHIVLRASRQKAARALLLQVQGGVALGWDGIGEGLSGGAAHKVALPLSAESAFSLVVRTRSHYMGPLQKTPLNIRFLATLGKKVPLSALIVPILHNGRVSHMLYVDNGHKQQAPTDVGEMLILSQRIGQTVEALVQRKRKAAQA